MSETAWKRESFIPGQELALLDVDVGVGEFGDRTHVVKMGVGNDDVRNCVRRDVHFSQHSSRRYPGRNSEFSREAGTVIVLHEASVDQHIAIIALREDE